MKQFIFYHQLGYARITIEAKDIKGAEIILSMLVANPGLWDHKEPKQIIGHVSGEL